MNLFRISMTLLGLLASLSMLNVSHAQTVPGSVTLSWKLPTTSVDGVALTGANALQRVEVYISTSPIASNSTMQPTLTLGPGAVTTTHTMQVANGSTLYARIKACNAVCSDFSAQGSKQVVLSTVPGVPTEVTIELTIGG